MAGPSRRDWWPSLRGNVFQSRADNPPKEVSMGAEEKGQRLFEPTTPTAVLEPHGEKEPWERSGDPILCPPLGPSPLLVMLRKPKRPARRRRVVDKLLTTILLIVIGILWGIVRGWW